MNTQNYWSLDCDILAGPHEASVKIAEAGTPAIAADIVKKLNRAYKPNDHGEEIRELGNMLFATTGDDAPRLLAISKRVAEIAASTEDNPPCPNCEHPGPETFQNGAWRCPECFGMGWVPSKTEADTDPCPKCEGGFSPQNDEMRDRHLKQAPPEKVNAQ